MAGISGLITAISNDLVAKIAAANLPPLVDKDSNGNPCIAIGRVSANINSFAPRVVFIPLSFRWTAMSPGHNSNPVSLLNSGAPGAGIGRILMTQYGTGYTSITTTVTIGAPDVAGGTQATATADVTSNGAVRGITVTNPGTGYLKPPTVTITSSLSGTGATATAYLRQTPQALTVMTQRPRYTEWHKFEVHCWGAASTNGVITPDQTQGAVLDYDATQQLMHQVIASTFLVAPGVHVVSSGQWADAQTTATVVDVVGHYAVFQMEIQGPVLAEPMVPTTGASIQFVPPQTKENPTEYIQPFDGSPPEQGVP